MEKIFLFDIGNVIAKSHNRKWLYDKLHCTCTYEEFDKEFRKSKCYLDAEHGVISTNKYLDEMRSKLGTNIDDKHYIDAHNQSKNGLYEDTVDLIQALNKKGYKVGILSNLKKIDVDYFKQVFDTNICDYEFYSCYVHAMKPSKEIYTHVASVVRPDINEVYFFDDLKENCDGAKKFGINAYQVTGKNIMETFNKCINKEGKIL